MTTLKLTGHIVPKARPNFDSRSGRAYHRKDYQVWLEDAGWQVAAARRGITHTEPVKIRIVLTSDSAIVRIEEKEVPERPTGVQGDIDNIAGSIMDALQAGGIIADDKQAHELEVYFYDEDLTGASTQEDQP